LNLSLDEVAKKIGFDGPSITSEARLPDKKPETQKGVNPMEMTLDNYAVAVSRIPIDQTDFSRSAEPRESRNPKTVIKSMLKDATLQEHIDAVKRPTFSSRPPRQTLSFQRQPFDRSFLVRGSYPSFNPIQPPRLNGFQPAQMPWIGGMSPQQASMLRYHQAQAMRMSSHPLSRYEEDVRREERRPMPHYDDVDVPPSRIVNRDVDKRRTQRSSAVGVVKQRSPKRVERVSTRAKVVKSVRVVKTPSYPTVKVTGIPTEFNRTDILSAFEEHFDVHNVIMKPRGSALVSFTSAEDARRAIQQFDGGELNDKKIKVVLVDSS